MEGKDSESKEKERIGKGRRREIRPEENMRLEGKGGKEDRD